MPHLNRKSINRLETCHPEIRDVIYEAIKMIDFTVIFGQRDRIQQTELVADGKSWTMDSKHLHSPSDAIDIAPWFSNAPHVRWDDEEAFIFLAGIIMRIAHEKGIKLIWGGNWDRDDEISDTKRRDLGHFERLAA